MRIMMQTASGRRVDPLALRPQDIDFGDIAHSLSLLCRFNGHCTEYYSVADHCVRVKEVVERRDALWALLHDASECYLRDCIRPLKPFVRFHLPAGLARWDDVEALVQRRIAERFALSWPMPETVRQADHVLLATEARDLMIDPDPSWARLAEPLAGRIRPRSIPQAYSAFIACFRALYRS